jgi:hypothetical protein
MSEISNADTIFYINELISIRDNIEIMPKFNQIEILRILCKHKEITLNENKYGIHINLTELPRNIIDDLKMYIQYVNTQEINLNEMEKQKREFINIYFTKDNKDNCGKNITYEQSSQSISCSESI